MTRQARKKRRRCSDCGEAREDAERASSAILPPNGGLLCPPCRIGAILYPKAVKVR